MAIDVGAVRAELAARLETIPRMQVHSSPPDRVRVPAAVVAHPESITYDAAYRRARDDMSIPIVVLVSKLNASEGAERLSDYASGSGAVSIKAVLEANADTYEAVSAIRVASVEFDVWSMAGDEYLCAVFTVLIRG